MASDAGDDIQQVWVSHIGMFFVEDKIREVAWTQVKIFHVFCLAQLGPIFPGRTG